MPWPEEIRSAVDGLTKYSVGDWLFGIVASLVAAVAFAGAVLLLRAVWHRAREFSVKLRRGSQAVRIVKIFVYRRYVSKKTLQSMSRGEFVVVTRSLQLFIAGFTIALLVHIAHFVVKDDVSLFLLAIPVWLLIDAVSWLDPRWAKRTIENPDESALSDAAAILGETVDEVRSHVIGNPKLR